MIKKPKADCPAFLRALNQSGKLLMHAGLIRKKINADKLIDHAVKQTGFSNFGDEQIIEGFNILCQSLNEDANLNYIGRHWIARFLGQALANQLQIIHWCSQHPYIYKNKISSPIIIVGMPRTGTQLLYRLLAQDNGFRAPLSWEVHNPFPPPLVAKITTDTRITRTDVQYALFHRCAPALLNLHSIGARFPENCSAIDVFSQQNLFWSSAFNLPAYSHWLQLQDYSSSLNYEKLFLQYLRSDYAEQRWLLCSSAHLQSLNALLAVYPDANIVHVHRNPLTTLGSLCHFNYQLRNVFSDNVESESLGKEQLELWSQILNQVCEQRAALDENQKQQFFDVQFEQLSQNPMSVIEKLYQHFNLPLGSVIRGRMQQLINNNTIESQQRINYNLQDFGLDEHRDMRRFHSYKSIFLN